MVRAEAAEQRERAMGWRTACCVPSRNRNVDFEFRSALLDRYGRPIFLGDEDVDLLDRFQDEGYRIPRAMPGPSRRSSLYTVHFPGKNLKLAGNMWLELTANLVLMIVLVFFTAYATNGLRKAERLNRLKSDLINNMTHELKTPISTIGLAGEALLDPAMAADADNVRYYVQLIRSENKRLGPARGKRAPGGHARPGRTRAVPADQVNFHDLLKEVLRNHAIHIKKQGGAPPASWRRQTPSSTGTAPT